MNKTHQSIEVYVRRGQQKLSIQSGPQKKIVSN